MGKVNLKIGDKLEMIVPGFDKTAEVIGINKCRNVNGKTFVYGYTLKVSDGTLSPATSTNWNKVWRII